MPAIEPGARGLGVPGAGGSRLSVANIGLPRTAPASRPSTKWAPSSVEVPVVQWTVPDSSPPLKVRLPLSVPCALPIVTNWPDWLTSTFGPRHCEPNVTS